jgi:hypothetical protein
MNKSFFCEFDKLYCFCTKHKKEYTQLRQQFEKIYTKNPSKDICILCEKKSSYHCGDEHYCTEHYNNIVESIGKHHDIDFFFSSDGSQISLVNDFIDLYKPKLFNNNSIKYENDLSLTNLNPLRCVFNQLRTRTSCSKIDGKDSDQSASSENDNERDRRALKADLMKVDATMSLRWGFEFRLLDAVSEAWNLYGLERKAKESEATIAQLAAELEAKDEAERFQEQSRQTQKLNFFVATFALVQVPATLMQISDLWLKRDSLAFNCIAVGTGVLATGIWLRMWFAHRNLKQIAA